MMSLSVDCWEDQKLSFIFFPFPKRNFKNVLLMDIFVLLQGPNMHVSVGEIHTHDYAEHVSNRSQLNKVLDFKS